MIFRSPLSIDIHKKKKGTQNIELGHKHYDYIKSKHVRSQIFEIIAHRAQPVQGVHLH